MDTCLYVPGAGGVNGGVMPPKCLPSPRCVARVHASNRQGTPFSMRKYLGGGESVERHRRQSIPIDEDADATPRSYPISHPPRDPPLCQDCRYFDARLSPCDVDADDVCCSTDFSHIRLTNGVHLDSPSEDDVLRAMLTNGCLRGAWWCDRCVALLSMPEIEVGHLFALLRQWTPCTQLQLDTIVMEVSLGLVAPILFIIISRYYQHFVLLDILRFMSNAAFYRKSFLVTSSLRCVKTSQVNKPTQNFIGSSDAKMLLVPKANQRLVRMLLASNVIFKNRAYQQVLDKDYV